MTATDTQVGILMRDRQKGKTQEQVAASANLRSRGRLLRPEPSGGHRADERGGPPSPPFDVDL